MDSACTVFLCQEQCYIKRSKLNSNIYSYKLYKIKIEKLILEFILK